MVSPDCHTLFGYVFYDDMNKKPVAQSQNQQIVLGFRTVHGLLSHLWTAIVVNCLTLIIKKLRFAMSDDMSMVSPSSAGEHGVLRSMQEVAMSSQEASKMLRTYNIAWWGNNYYDVNELGHISVCPDPDVPEARVDLAELVKAREAQGQRLPALFCFPQILQHRLRSINAAFKRARESYGYNGDYFLVYPIKVNQHRRVIESLIHSGEPLGLEAGSKAELMAVLAHAG
ncbi:Biosynthetic arginine decarboxylase [Klebsiella pneumoniae IS43]|uniref:Uncharacterized protein YqgB n=1 Tax=Klebsiella pneumoniae IS43 TaxID=1432552 RepID=W1DP52_KLEPN|nr:Biosynthetic arginine decarboxylase [Klebsiella pneumoniae IS43]